MQYRINPKNGDAISALGFGCMRFGRDEKAAEAMVRRAIDAGVNYFDTAYLYPGNEAVLGRILSKDGLRARVKVATKLPQYLVRRPEDVQRMFAAELERLQTDHIDYYLMHMLPDVASWERLVSLGIVQWVAEKKHSGQIGNIGFSFHGAQADFFQLVDAYDWDFCMIQYNYLDENNQAGRAGLLYAAEKGLPVMVMEPLRGGTLVSGLPKGAKDAFLAASIQRSAADWGLRWVLNQPQVLCALSGMTTMDMLEENLRVAEDALPERLTDAEMDVYAKAARAIREATKVPCTGCGYCMPCPAGVDIPLCFASLNDTTMKGRLMSTYWYALMAQGHEAGRCVACGKCEAHCPQGIAIREKMKETQKTLEGWLYGPVSLVVRQVIRRKGKGTAR